MVSYHHICSTAYNSNSTMQLSFLSYCLQQQLFMVKCPICNRHIYQAYLHLQHNYLICSHCMQTARQHQQQHNYVYVLPSALDNQQIINNTLALHAQFAAQKVPPQRVFQEQLIQKRLGERNSLKEDSTSLTISTEDTQFSKSDTNTINYSSFVAQKYKQTVGIIGENVGKIGEHVRMVRENVGRMGQHVSPLVDRLSKTKTSLEESSRHWEQKVMAIKATYSQISSEMPPLKEIAKQSLKRGIGKLFSHIF